MRRVPSYRPTTAVRLAGAILAAALVVLISTTSAWAHNQLRSASPARDTTLTTAPTQVVLEFAERLDPTFTTIVVTDPGKKRVATGEPVVAGARGTVTLTQPLGNGTYTVAYRVVSADGHPVQGSYPFTVAVPGAPAAPTPASSPSAASAAPAAAATARSDTGGPAGTVTAALAVVLLAAVAAGLLWWRRTRRRVVR